MRYANGGHPPALLIDGSQQATDLDAQGLPVGFFSKVTYVATDVRIPPASRIYVFSDGCYETQMCDGEVRTREEMVQYLCSLTSDRLLQLDALYQHSMNAQDGKHLDDDFSIVCATFQ